MIRAKPGTSFLIRESDSTLKASRAYTLIITGEPVGAGSPVILFTALTNILNNFVVAVLFAPIGYAAIGVDNPYSAMFMLMLIVSSYLSIALPCSSSTAIFLHAEKDMFKSRQLIGYGYLFTMLFCVIALVVLFFLQPLFGV